MYVRVLRDGGMYWGLYVSGECVMKCAVSNYGFLVVFDQTG